MVVSSKDASQEDIRSNLHGMLDGSIALPRSIWHHVRMRHLELAEQIAGRTPVYLDSRFWFDLQRAEEGQKDKARIGPLLTALRYATRCGKIFCPISASTSIELLKHGDRGVRLRSAQLVDELSLGVAVADPNQLAEAELEWLLSKPGDQAIDPLSVPVWTKVTNSFGSLVPEQHSIPARTMLALQVATFDEVWSSSLAELTVRIQQVPDLGSAEVASRLTEGNRTHAHEVTDFESVYRAEVAGSADLYARMFSDVMRRKAGAAGVASTEPTPEDLHDYRNVIGNIQLLGKARQALRSFHIRASLYAIMRLNRDRRFKPNDLLDFEHAVAGVGYCGAFFSERSLVATITQKPLQLDRLYECLVTNNIEQAMRFVSSL